MMLKNRDVTRFLIPDSYKYELYPIQMNPIPFTDLSKQPNLFNQYKAEAKKSESLILGDPYDISKKFKRTETLKDRSKLKMEKEALIGEDEQKGRGVKWFERNHSKKGEGLYTAGIVSKNRHDKKPAVIKKTKIPKIVEKEEEEEEEEESESESEDEYFGLLPSEIMKYNLMK